ncbi:MAG: 4-(cytidine 5'-diphospho)-2-C-methyl-D-erythritol kinase [Gemmatimonadota bacterium]
MRITIAAPAKVNLRLRVGPREASGFHAIDTIFCALRLADTVMVWPDVGPEPTLETAHARPLTGPPTMGPPESNLAVRAARAYLERAGLAAAPGIRLVKRIPAGAGLGGGSSDAAAVLRALDRLHPGNVAPGDLRQLAMSLGSDVPFFLEGAPCAHGVGRGERLRGLSPLPERAVVVAIPGLSIRTRDAYAWLDEDRGETEAPVPEPPIEDLAWDDVAGMAVNDFEGPIFRRYPRLRAVRDRLRKAGARPALLAGSGATVFGVYETEEHARSAAAALQKAVPGVGAVVTRTRTR